MVCNHEDNAVVFVNIGDNDKSNEIKYRQCWKEFNLKYYSKYISSIL